MAKKFLGMVFAVLTGLIIAGCDDGNGPETKAYTVTIGTLTNANGSTITASPTAGPEGTEITLLITPANGYRLKAGTLKYNGTQAIDETTAKFGLPAENVTVAAEFEVDNPYKWGKWINKEGDPNLTDNAVEYSINQTGDVTIIARETASTGWYINVNVHYTAPEEARYKVSFDIQIQDEEEKTVSIFWGKDPNSKRGGFQCGNTMRTISYETPEKAEAGDDLRVDFIFGYEGQTGTYLIKNFLISPIEE